MVPLEEEATVDEQQASGFPDPWENTNRKMLWFDRQLDGWVITPAVDIYQFLVPEPARHAVRRFCLNINSPAVLVNDLLQREWADASITTERFLINSTVGIGGLFDPAEDFGLPRHSSDFGQTLALAGLDSGPYVVLPFFGPSNVRDASGAVVDFLLQPMLYALPIAALFVFEGSRGLSLREAHAESLEALRASSIDYYSALRSAYYQTRTADIWRRRAAHQQRNTAAAATRDVDGRPPSTDALAP
ncbi:MAG: VacJ family lipoprotein [Candidatus Binatia bacterium]